MKTAVVQSLSITGGMIVVRYCLKCSRISATFEALVDFETGMTVTSGCVEGGVSTEIVAADARKVGVITRDDMRVLPTPATAFI